MLKSIDIADRLVFAWWNTGVSPPKRGGRAGGNELEIASQVVSALLRDASVDCLGLAEVTEDDLERFLGDSASPSYSAYVGTLREGRAQFDTGALFNTERLSLVDQKAVFDRRGSQVLKLANMIALELAEDSHPFHVFLSHWPSHLVPDSESTRIALASRLRRFIDDTVTGCDGDARLILMGDFNEEPFHECLEGQLLATRDRGLAVQSPSRLYNPFWRHLGEIEPYVQAKNPQSCAGTCRVPKGRETNWKTVDQIIVSSSFLGASCWHLNEELTGVMSDSLFGSGSEERSRVLDLLPVFLTIE